MMKIHRSYFVFIFIFILLLVSIKWFMTSDIKLNKDCNGKVIEVQNRQFFTISLSSNPTTGYSWQIANNPDPEILVQKGHDYKSAYNPTNMLGVGGTEYWRFQAVGVGYTKIRLIYMRSHGSVQTLGTFSVDVRVSESVSPVINIKNWFKRQNPGKKMGYITNFYLRQCDLLQQCVSKRE